MKDKFSQFTSKVTNLRRDRKEIVDELIEVKNKWLNSKDDIVHDLDLFNSSFRSYDNFQRICGIATGFNNKGYILVHDCPMPS